MNYEQFTNEISQHLKDMTHCTDIHPIEVPKNNGTVRTGIAVKIDGDNSRSVYINIYLDKYFDDYKKGMKLSDIIYNVCLTYKTHLKSFDFDLYSLELDYPQVKEKIVYRLINYDKNRELLNRVPFIPYLDLAIVFFVLLKASETTVESVPIDNILLSSWNIDKEQLLTHAMLNTPRLLPVRIEAASNISIGIEAAVSSELENMYIISNEYYSDGACCLLYNNILKDLGILIENDFYILPSSTDEVILLPKRESEDTLFLEFIIKEINKDVVDADEVLSDHLYYYDRKAEELTILNPQ